MSTFDLSALSGIPRSMGSIIGGRGTWPPPEVKPYQDLVEFHCALRDSNEPYLRAVARSLPKQMGGDIQLPYYIFALAMRVSRASTALLLGEAPVIAAANTKDQPRMDYNRRVTDLDAKLRQAGITCSSEGLCWGVVSKSAATPKGRQAPKVKFYSFLRGIPTWDDDELISIKMVRNEWYITNGNKPQRTDPILRLLECHEAGSITYEAWLGKETEQGRLVPLEKYPQTQPFADAGGPTGIDELLVVPFFNAASLDGVPISDYYGLEDLFLSLNESLYIAKSSERLMKPVALIAEELLDQRKNLPGGYNVISHRGDMVELGSGKGSPIEIINGSFDPKTFCDWQDYITRVALTLSGTSEQMLGNDPGGAAASGTALKMRMAAALMEASGKAQYFRTALTQLLRLMALLDGIEVQGCTTYVWADADTPPEVTLEDGIPDDPQETAMMLAALPDLAMEDRFRFAFPGRSQREVGEMVARAKDQQKEEIDNMKAQMGDQLGAPIDGLPKFLAGKIPSTDSSDTGD